MMDIEVHSREIQLASIDQPIEVLRSQSLVLEARTFLFSIWRENVILTWEGR